MFRVTILRLLLAGNNSLLLVSSLIVLAVQGSLIAAFPDGSGSHNVYELTVAALCVWFYTMGIIAAMLRANNGYFAPIDLIFTILWFAAFIIMAVDYNHNDCAATAPPLGSCSKKHASEAFAFLAFFFSLVATVLDVLIYLQDSTPENAEDVPPPPETNVPATREEATENEDAAAAKAEIRPVPESLSKKLPDVV